MLLLVATTAFGDSGRLAVGVQTGTGFNPVEPVWTAGDVAPASAVVCGGVAGWWVTGGHDYAGPRGEVLRTDDDQRWGFALTGCPTTRGGTQGTLGAGYGRQWGGRVYFTATSTVGVSVFAKSADDHHYTAFAPFAKPAFAMGLAIPPGMSVEVGPYAVIAPPLWSVADVAPTGAFWGHVGVELTVLAGAASPQVPWR